MHLDWCALARPHADALMLVLLSEGCRVSVTHSKRAPVDAAAGHLQRSAPCLRRCCRAFASPRDGDPNVTADVGPPALAIRSRRGAAPEAVIEHDADEDGEGAQAPATLRWTGVVDRAAPCEVVGDEAAATTTALR